MTAISGMRQGARWPFLGLSEREMQCLCCILPECYPKHPLCLYHTWDEQQSEVDAIGAAIVERTLARALRRLGR